MYEMTSERIAEDRAICDAATGGPWTQDSNYVVAEIKGGRPHGEVIVESRATVDKHRDTLRDIRNSAFIAAARTRWPEALTALEEAQRERDRFENKEILALSDTARMESRLFTEQQRAEKAEQRVKELDAAYAQVNEGFATLAASRGMMEQHIEDAASWLFDYRGSLNCEGVWDEDDQAEYVRRIAILKGESDG